MKSVFVFPPLRKHLAGQHDQETHGSWALDRFDRPNGYEGLNVPAGELPDTVYHVTSSKNDQAISAGGLHAHPENTWNTGAGSYNKYEDNWVWGKGEDGEWQKEEYRPVGVYVFGSLNAAKNYAQSGNSIYSIDTKTTLADGADVIRDPSWSENWDYMSDPESEQAWVFNNVPVEAISLVMQKHQAGNHDQESHGSWATGSDGIGTDYRMSHRAPNPEENAPAYDLTGDGAIYPDDVYSADGARLYGGGEPEMARRVHSLITAMRGNPNAKVQIYRAVPKGIRQVNVGDWVTIDRQYAEQHGQSNLNNDYEILTNTVNADEIYTDGNSLFEWSYYPRVQKHQAGKHDQSSHGNWASEAGIPIPENPDGTFVEAIFPKDFHKKLTEKEFQSVGNYQHDGYKEINKVLRFPKNFEEPYQQHMSSTIEAIDSAIVKAGEVVPDNTAVFRVVPANFFMGAPVLGVPPKEIGSVITDKGYTSTTMIDLSKLSSDDKASYARSNKMLIRIDLGKNKSGLAVNSIYENYNKVGLFTLQEREFLLPRGTSFEYAGFDEVNRIHVLKRLP